MKILSLVMLLSFFSIQSYASSYKCFASKYPDHFLNAFEDGYTILTIEDDIVNLKFFYVNTVTKETTMEINADFQISKINNGNGKIKGYSIADIVEYNSVRNEIYTLFIDPFLINNTDFSKKGIIGKFTFKGHGYSYDWNICYNLK